MPCISCGYELKGLDADGPCPECGAPVVESFYGEGLVHASPAYLARLERGLWLVRVAIGMIVITLVGGIVVSIVLGMILPWTLPSWASEVLVVVTAMVCVGAYVAGWWLVTTPDPRFSQHADTRSATCARWSAVALIATLVFFVVFSLVVPAVLALFGPAVAILFIVQHSCGSVYLRAIARRATNRRAMSLAKKSLIAVLVVCAGAVVQIGFNGFGVQAPGGGLMRALLRFLISTVPIVILVAALTAIVQQFSALGLLRDDLRRLLFTANQRG